MVKFLIVAALVGTGAGLTLIADVFLKKANGFTFWPYFLAGVALYAAVAVPVTIAFTYVEFGPLFIIWESLYLVLGLIIGSLIFKEPFTLNKAIAGALMFGAIMLVNK